MVLSYCRKSGSSSINQFLWQTCQIIGFQVSLHSEKNVIFEKCQAYKSKIYPTHIAHHMQISKYDLTKNMIKWKRIISVWNFMGAFYCFLEWKVIKNAHEKFLNRIYSFSFYHGFINSSHVSEGYGFCAFYFLSASQIFSNKRNWNNKYVVIELAKSWPICTYM
jgi:hypothetical protein